MNTAIWVLQGLLAAFFMMPAFMKLTKSKEEMIEKKQLEPGKSIVPIRLIGFVEVLGIIGIIVPYATGIAPILTPLAAIGFAMVMVGAFAVHFQKKEYKVLPMLVVAFVLSLVVAYYRW